MKKAAYYKERDYDFGQRMLKLRTTINLTQAGLAEQLGVGVNPFNRTQRKVNF